jgi:hypothetical protein
LTFKPGDQAIHKHRVVTIINPISSGFEYVIRRGRREMRVGLLDLKPYTPKQPATCASIKQPGTTVS